MRRGAGRASKTKRSRGRVKLFGACLFLLYLAGLVYFLILSEDFGHGGAGDYSYNLVPFREILRYLRYRELLGTRAVALNLIGNVVGFVPFGALVPYIARGARKFWRTTLLTLELSLAIEVVQLIFSVGCFDVDDLILNTLGGFLGYLLFWIAAGGSRRKGG